MAREHDLCSHYPCRHLGLVAAQRQADQGIPCAKAFSTVAWPPCDTRAAPWGNPRACGTHGVTTTWGASHAACRPPTPHLPTFAEAEIRQGACPGIKSALSLLPSRRRHCNAIGQPHRRQPLRTLLSTPHIPVSVSGRWVVSHPLLAGRGAFACQCRTHRPSP